MARTSWHVWIARGDQCASGDFVVEQDTAESAKAEVKENAAKLWESSSKNMGAHPSSECDQRGCNG